LVETKKEYEGDTLFLKRRIIEGYIHSNDRCDNRACIVEKIKDKNGYVQSKRVYGCLRNLYDGNQCSVVEEYLNKKGEIKNRFVNGQLMICRLSDLPIELKDKSANPEVFTAGKDAKSMLHKHLDTLSSLGRFAKGLTASTKKTAEVPKTFIGSKGTVGKNDERLPTQSPLSKSMKGIIHWENENYETNNDISPQPMASPVRPTEEWKPADAETLQLSLKIEDLMGSKNFAGGESQYGEHRDMVSKFLLGVREPPTSKADEEQKFKDDNLIERYLARMKIPAVTEVEIEEKRRDEELLARYLSEAKHVTSENDDSQRKDDCDMLLRHFGMFGLKTLTPEDKQAKQLDEEKVEIFMEQTLPTLKEETLEHRQDNEWLAKIMLHKSQTIKDPETIVVDKKNEDFIFKALAKFKEKPKTEEETRQRNRDEELMARWLARKKIEPKNSEEVSQRKRDEDWMGKYLLRMEKPAKTKPEKEQARKDNDWMARFMLRTRPELEENKEDEDERRNDEAMILNFVKKIEAPAEQVASVTERRQDAALLARFLHPKPVTMTPMEEEQEFHKEEVITDFLMQHEPVKSTLRGNELDHMARYLAGKNLKQSQGWDKPLVTKEEPKVENYVIQDNDHKKTFIGLQGLIQRGTEGKLIQSEVFVERPASVIIGKKDGSPGSIRSFTSGKDLTQITDLRRMEDMVFIFLVNKIRLPSESNEGGDGSELTVR
jgi:hypothetical protein